MNKKSNWFDDTKNPFISFVLCLFFGVFGAHKFYSGKICSGVLYLFTFGLFGVGWIIDIIKTFQIMISFCKKSKPFDFKSLITSGNNLKDLQNNWYDNYDEIVSQKVKEKYGKYDFETVSGIEAIPVPTKKQQMESSIETPVFELEYVLSKKATEHKKNGNMDAAIACLKKANELYPYSKFEWSEKDYMRYPEYLRQAGRFEEAREEEQKIRDTLMENNAFYRNTHSNEKRDILIDVLKQAYKLTGTDTIIVGDSSFLCAECAKYRRRVFSVDGKDKRFPIPPDNLRYRVPSQHKYCDFPVFSFAPDISEPNFAYSGSLSAWSNRPFVDDRTAEEKALFEKRVEEREQEERDRENYNLLREKAPELAPKSFSGYRRMRNANTANFQKIKEQATEYGLFL